MIPHQILDLQWLVTTGTLVVTTHTFLDTGITEPVSASCHVSIGQIAHAYWTAEIVRYTLDLQTEQQFVIFAPTKIWKLLPKFDSSGTRNLQLVLKASEKLSISVADPEFPTEGRQPLRGGAQPTIGPFSRNLHENEEILASGRGRPLRPIDQPLHVRIMDSSNNGFVCCSHPGFATAVTH